jgi:undecaprenyl diphosphate synthase
MSKDPWNDAPPDHVGIIMDGNGRWALSRGLPRVAGHQAGVQAVRRTVKACGELGVRILTLYTFSTENWRRPRAEVISIMRLVEEYAVRELPELQRNGVRVLIMGRREGMPDTLTRVLDQIVRQTQDNGRMTMVLALNYGGRAELVDAARAISAAYVRGEMDVAAIDEAVLSQYLYCPDLPDADLIIRTGGESRLSNFLLWRAIGAEFWSTPILWPDFQREHLMAAIEAYQDQSGENRCLTTNAE